MAYIIHLANIYLVTIIGGTVQDTWERTETKEKKMFST